MAQSPANIIIRIVFSAKACKPWVNGVNEPELHASMCGICRNLDGPVSKMNGSDSYDEKQLWDDSLYAGLSGLTGLFALPRPDGLGYQI